MIFCCHTTTENSYSFVPSSTSTLNIKVSFQKKRKKDFKIVDTILAMRENERKKTCTIWIDSISRLSVCVCEAYIRFYLILWLHRCCIGYFIRFAYIFYFLIQQERERGRVNESVSLLSVFFTFSSFLFILWYLKMRTACHSL